MSKFILILLSTVLLSAAGSCDAAFKDWDPEHQQQFKTFLMLQTIDTYQTSLAIKCQQWSPECPLRERNPLLGSHPNSDALLLQKIIGSYVVYKLLDMEQNERRKGKTLRWMNTAFVIVVTNNGIQLRKTF